MLLLLQRPTTSTPRTPLAIRCPEPLSGYALVEGGSIYGSNFSEGSVTPSGFGVEDPWTGMRLGAAVPVRGPKLIGTPNLVNVNVNVLLRRLDLEDFQSVLVGAATRGMNLKGVDGLRLKPIESQLLELAGVGS